MTTTTYTTTGISLAKLVTSPANVRRTGATAGIEALAASIQAHGLLQSLVVRPQLDGKGQATSRFEVIAGGRRLAALKLLTKKKQLGKGTTIPCRLLDGEAVTDTEASLAENVMRLDMHPADQFEAFLLSHRQGTGIEDIAARFGVSAHTVRQRLRLAVVSPALRQAYRDEVLTLDHLMAFAVTEDQTAQEAVFAQLPDWQRYPHTIRHLLTHALVSTTDRKVALVGLDSYLAAGGTVQRDLFSAEGGGWIADPLLLERLVAGHLEAAAEALRAEGWKWIAIGEAAAMDMHRLRRVWPEAVALTEPEAARQADLATRYEALVETHESSGDKMPKKVIVELDAIEQELADIELRTRAFRAEDRARAGVSLTVALDGSLRVERGFVRPEDEARPASSGQTASGEACGADGEEDRIIADGAEPKAPALSARLLAELEAHRTAGLQAALAGQSELALRVLLHGLATDSFYARYDETVARFHVLPPALSLACPGIEDSPARQAMTAAEAAWRNTLPNDHAALWDWLQGQEMPALLALLAVCVARTANVGSQSWVTPTGSQSLAAKVAVAAGLDMRQCWTATTDSYLGRVSKAAILDAVREAVGTDVAARLAGAKKAAMAQEAEALLAGKGWLPAVLQVLLPAKAAPEEDIVLSMAAE